MTPIGLSRRFTTPGTTIIIVGAGETFTLAPCDTATTVSLRTGEAYAIRAEAEAVSLRDRLSNHLKEEVEYTCGCSGCVALVSKRGQICKSCQRQRQKLHQR